MVAGVDDAGVVGQAGVAECAEDVSDQLIDERAHGVVDETSPADGLFRANVLSRLHARLAESGQGRVHGPLIGRPGDGHVDVVKPIAALVMLGGGKWEVGQGEGHEQAPGFVVRWRLGVEPTDGFGGDGGVVADVLGVRGASVVDMAELVARDRHVGAKAAVDVPYPVHDVHGDALVGKADVVGGVAVVELADGGDGVAVLCEPMTPAGGAIAGVGRGVIPGAYLVDVTTGGEAGAGGDADGGVAVGSGERGAGRGQVVQIWGLRQRVSSTAQHAGVVLVGHENQEVLGFHGVSGLRGLARGWEPSPPCVPATR